MILIADSGATKTDWCFGTSLQDIQFVQTEGINPFHMTESEIQWAIQRHLLPQLPENAWTACTEIYFYGSGCLPTKTATIIEVLKQAFPEAAIRVQTDLLGAARALCKHEAGIACILGTGSNSCLYNGNEIIENTSPLGYILGDEGSGAYIGRRFISDCLKKQLPYMLTKGLLQEYSLTPADILDKVYRQPQANRFLASVTPYIHKYKEMPEVKTFLLDCFDKFFTRNIVQYKQLLPISFTGSIAWYFQDEIKESAAKLGLRINRFIQNPIKELAAYHLPAS